MGEEIQEWQHLWGAKVKMPIDVPDDILKDGVNTVRAKLEVRFVHRPVPCTARDACTSPASMPPSHLALAPNRPASHITASHTTALAVIPPRARAQAYPDFEGEGGAKVVEEVKTEFDERWGPSWHCVMGKAFGSFVTHETQNFMYFYIGDKACMLFKAG